MTLTERMNPSVVNTPIMPTSEIPCPPVAAADATFPHTDAAKYFA